MEVPLVGAAAADDAQPHVASRPHARVVDERVCRRVERVCIGVQPWELQGLVWGRQCMPAWNIQQIRQHRVWRRWSDV